MEKPINFTAEMIQKILDGTKSQTRRPCKKVPEDAYDVEYYHEEGEWYWKCGHISNGCALDWIEPIKMRHQVGDLLWCREGWAPLGHWVDICPDTGFSEEYIYKTDFVDSPEQPKWKSPVTMPKEAARIWLEVEKRWVERLWDISWEDAIEEGALLPFVCMRYRHIWEGSYNEKHKPEFMWERNPFVEVYKFRRVEHV